MCTRLVRGLQEGTLKKNFLPTLPITEDGVLKQTKMVLDQNWHWIHTTAGSDNCYNSDWDKTICPDPQTCSRNCAIEGIEESEYLNPYGISVSGGALTLRYVTQGTYGTNVGSRVYLMNEDGKTYRGFDLRNKEFVFTADMSNADCGLNGAIYFVEMPLAGSSMIRPWLGQGYGDAQCAKDMKTTTDGLPNILKLGSCSAEMDIWEANSRANAFTPHTCSNTGVANCRTAAECGDGSNRYSGWCDKDGADYNPYRLGNRTLYGRGSTFSVDSTKPFQVITQFFTHDNTDNGDLVRIQRWYKQDGRTIDGGVLTDQVIQSHKDAWGDINHYEILGGMKGMGESLARKHVLVLSLWDDESPARMMWLDSTYPTENPNRPGAVRGPCPTTGGIPSVLRATVPNSKVVYSDIQVNRLRSTPPSPSPSTPSQPPSPSPSTPPSKPPSEPCAWICKQCSPCGQ